MKVFKLNQSYGQPDCNALRFMSKREATNYALTMGRAYGSSIHFKQDETGRFMFETVDLEMSVDATSGRVVLLDASGDPSTEATLKQGGYFSLDETRVIPPPVQAA